MFDRPRSGERALLVRIGAGRQPAPADLEELSALASSAGAVPVGTITGSRPRPDPRFYMGSGKADEVKARAEELSADVILVDHALSPSQERNLEKHIGRRVLDRSGLILDIFAQRARSHEGKLQVELAQLKHLQTRLVRGWTHLERQKGGIGMRGPGETQLESDRRLIANRVRTLTRRLEKLAQQRDTGRQTRKEVPIQGAAIVGYTNAGKSSLLNKLTGSEVLAANKLFATLDPTTRRLALPSGRALLLTDTVGFVRRLPHRLVEAFKATLEEAVQADFLIHVIDLGSPERDKHAETTLQVLTEIGAGDRPVITVLNKADLCDEVERAQALAAYPDAKLVSTKTGEGLTALLQRLEECAASRDEHMTLLIPHDQYAMLSKLHAGATILNSKALPEGTRVEVYVPTRLQETCRAWSIKE